MIYLLDTHVVLWAALEPDLLSEVGRRIIDDDMNGMMFSSAVIWEVGIKFSRGRADFAVDPRLLRRALLENGYSELTIDSDHAIAAVDLPPVHKDPFDRIQVAQARVEGLVLLTHDPVVARYGSPVELI